MRTECAAGSLSLSIFSDRTLSIFVSQVRHFSTLVKPSSLPIMSATAQTGIQWRRHSHTSPPRSSPPLSARSLPYPLGGYCYSSHAGLQTGDSLCGLPFIFSPNNRGGPDRLFRRGITDLDGRRSQRQTRGVEFAA